MTIDVEAIRSLALLIPSEAYTRADARELARLALQLLAAYERACGESDEMRAHIKASPGGHSSIAQGVTAGCEFCIAADNAERSGAVPKSGHELLLAERDQLRALLAEAVEIAEIDTGKSKTEWRRLAEIRTAAGLAKGNGDE